jgi:hypothetical protein
MYINLMNSMHEQYERLRIKVPNFKQGPSGRSIRIAYERYLVELKGLRDAFC